jgi:hypothetical protein
MRFGFRVMSVLVPKLFSKNEAGPFERPSAVPLRRWLIVCIQRTGSFRHSAIVQSLFPEAYGLNGGEPRTKADFVYGLDAWAGCLTGFDHAVVLVGAAADDKQKHIIRLEDSRQQVLAYMKYAEQPLAQQKIQNEYQLLSTLRSGLGPKPLKFDRFGEGRALLMSATTGRPFSFKMPPVHDDDRFDNLCRFLNALECEKTYEIREHPAIVRLQKTLSICQNHPDTGSLLPVDVRLDQDLMVLRDCVWPVVIQHGDLTPWNLYDDHGVLSAIDWEDGCLVGFPGVDLVYFCIQTCFFLQRWPVQRTCEAACKALDYAINEAIVYRQLNGVRMTPGAIMALVRIAAMESYLRGRGDGLSDEHELQQYRLKIGTIRYVYGSKTA